MKVSKSEASPSVSREIQIDPKAKPYMISHGVTLFISLCQKRIIQKSAENQHKQLISNMNYQMDQALLNQLQSAGVTVGAEMGGARNPAKAILQPTTSSLFDFMSVQNFSHDQHGSGSGHASASQSTRHGGGKKFDRLNLTTNL